MSAVDRPQAEADAASLAATLLAIDPAGLGGACLRAAFGPARERWLAHLRAVFAPDVPWRRLPAGTTVGRLLGGLDLAATLRTGQPVAERGLLAEADGGVVVVPMAERLQAETIAHLAAALDRGEVVLERDGVARRLATRFALVLLDEGFLPDEGVAGKLIDRVAFTLELDTLVPSPAQGNSGLAASVGAARRRLPDVVIGEDIAAVLSETAVVLGVASLRPVIFALRAARAVAALAGRAAVTAADAAVAAGLVLSPRATRVPVEAPPPQPAEAPPQSDPNEGDSPAPEPARGERRDGATQDAADDLVLAAARAAIPAGLLAQLQAGSTIRREQSGGGRAGQPQASMRRGRPAGVRAGSPKSGARLDIVETLRAAAPWQRLRAATATQPTPKVLVRGEDFRIARYKRRAETTTVFVVDASGSSALNRLAEAKGAVELILADCYVRRDQVALVSFRGRGAELMLPPTRSLARAKRCLAGLPGGGGTPLAAGIRAACDLADAVRRKGQTAAVVLMTDGRANVTLDGSAGRSAAEAEALAAARNLRAADHGVLFVDTSPRPHPFARHLADAMAAHYIALPKADAVAISRAVRDVGPHAV